MKIAVLLVTLGLALVIVSVASLPVDAQGDTLSQLIVVIENSTLDNAGTDDRFEINLLRNGQVYHRFSPTSQSWDELEDGRTESYQWNLGAITNQENKLFNASMFTNANLCIRTMGEDAWTPNRVWVLGRNANTGRMELLAYVSDWPNNLRLSNDLSEGNPAYTLTLQPILTCR